MSNIRFTELFKSSPVKLTIRPGQVITHNHRYHNGEGWSWESDSWEVEGEYVVNRWGRGGRDCDGYQVETGICVCEISKLQSREYEGNKLPEWRRINEHAYDRRGEIVNY